MNYLKIQTEVLKRLMKEKEVVYSKEEGGYWLLNDRAFLAVFIPKCFMFLNVENSKAAKPTGNLNRLYGREYDYSKAALTGMSKVIHDPIMGDIECAEVITTEGEKVRTWINKKFLKYLDTEARFFIKDTQSVVLVKEYMTGDQVVAIICPVRDR